MDCSMAGFPVHHQLPELTQTHVHRVGNAIQPSHPLSSPSPAFNLSQHQGLFQWVSSLHQVVKVLEFQLQHQSFQWIFRTENPMNSMKSCTQYASKIRKLSSGHRTGKGQFLLQSQRRAVTKNVQTTIQLCSFHMLAKLCSKSIKLDFNNTWTENFQMYKLSLENAEEPEIKLLTFVES